MSTRIEKEEFLSEFQNKIIQSRQLLINANHRWGDKLLTDIYHQIEKADWIDMHKKRQLIMIISNTWWMYLNSLVKREGENIHVDIIRYIDGYNRFFSFLSRLDDFYFFNTFFINLLKTFVKIPEKELSVSGITKFINSFSIKVKEREEFLNLIELQILLVYLRKTVFPSDLFSFCLEILGKITSKLEPSKRALFLYIILEDVNFKFQLMEDSSEFIKIINKILVNRLPNYLKNEFINLSRISINERNFNTILIDLEELIYYLNYIGESKWIITILKIIFSKIQQYQTFEDAVSYIRRYIDFAINRNQFEIAFAIYDFLEDIFIYRTDLGYDNILIELWIEACKNFLDKNEKRFVLRSLEKVSTHLKMPQTTEQVFHFFRTCNYLWQFKSMFFSLEPQDFWRMMFYRAFYEEKDFNLASKIIPYLDTALKPVITDLNSLSNATESSKTISYSFKENIDKQKELAQNNIIKQIVIRIDFKGQISYLIRPLENTLIEGKISDEFWNDAQIFEIFEEIFSEQKKKKYNFNLADFGRLLYIFLPKQIRELLSRLKINKNTIPQIFFGLDTMSVPFELIYDKGFFSLKYSSGYLLGEPPLGGIIFEEAFQDQKESSFVKNKYNVLIVESTNQMGPVKWNDENKTKEIVFPFLAGASELKHITDFFNNRNEVNQITVLSGKESTRESILLNLSRGANHIVHFVGNIFYSKWSPKDSYFLTNDNNIIKISEIFQNLNLNELRIPVLLFFNAQIYDIDGIRKRNTMKLYGEILSNLDFDRVISLIARNYPVFDEDTKVIITYFYENILNGLSQGVALLKARQQYVAKLKINLEGQPAKNLEQKEAFRKINLEAGLAIASFVLFGNPTKKI